MASNMSAYSAGHTFIIIYTKTPWFNKANRVFLKNGGLFGECHIFVMRYGASCRGPPKSAAAAAAEGGRPKRRCFGPPLPVLFPQASAGCGRRGVRHGPLAKREYGSQRAWLKQILHFKGWIS